VSFIYGTTTQYTSSVKYAAVAGWASAHAYAVGAIIRQTVTPSVNNERCFICTAAGTSGGTEPTWTMTRGDKLTESSGPTWVESTGVAVFNGDGPNTPNWLAVKNQSTGGTGQVITDVAGTHVFVCTTSGSTGNGAEPTWNTSAVGNTTTDNTVTWTYVGLVSTFAATPWGATVPMPPPARAGDAFGVDHRLIELDGPGPAE
jgi:hypothetical protein